MFKGSDSCCWTQRTHIRELQEKVAYILCRIGFLTSYFSAGFDSRISVSKSNGLFITTNYLLTAQDFMLGYFDT